MNILFNIVKLFGTSGVDEPNPVYSGGIDDAYTWTWLGIIAIEDGYGKWIKIAGREITI